MEKKQVKYLSQEVQEIMRNPKNRKRMRKSD
jgi:hypothetical protein